MIKNSIALVFGSVLALSGHATADTSTAADAAEAKGIVKEFFTSLKGELQGAIKTGGPVSAISICQERAPAIAKALSDKTGWEVGRTSLKLRNPELNSPDAWERAVLMEFEKRALAGEDVKTMAYSETVNTGQGQRYRFMKAIPTGEVCLLCHGANISPDIAEAIDQAYPQDQAKGYAAGDVRGAFTLSKPM